MSWIFCSCGGQHWGRYGAAGLLLTAPDRSAVLLQRRSAWVHNPLTWGLVGGALDRGESPTDAALREATEETSLASRDISVLGTVPDQDHGLWRYTYVLATYGKWRPSMLGKSLPGGQSWESDGAVWQPLDRLPPRTLPALRRDWPRLVVEVGRRR